MKWLAFLVTLALAFPVWATDGDHVRTYQFGNYLVREYLLCDGATGGATKTCADFDLKGRTNARGIPTYMVFDHLTDTDCSGTPDTTPTGKNVAGGPTADIASALSAAGDDQIVISTIPNSIIAADVADGADCSDLEIGIKLFYEIQRK